MFLNIMYFFTNVFIVRVCFFWTELYAVENSSFTGSSSFYRSKAWDWLLRKNWWTWRVMFMFVLVSCFFFLVLEGSLITDPLCHMKSQRTVPNTNSKFPPPVSSLEETPLQNRNVARGSWLAVWTLNMCITNFRTHLPRLTMDKQWDRSGWK